MHFGFPYVIFVGGTTVIIFLLKWKTARLLLVCYCCNHYDNSKNLVDSTAAQL